MVKKVGKLKKIKDVSMDDDTSAEADAYDEEQAALSYPGTKGIGMPEKGKQQVKGFKFSGTY